MPAYRSEVYRLIGKAIADVRQKKGFKRSELAENIIKVDTLERVEMGKIGLSSKVLELLCSKLGVPLSYVFILACTSDESDIIEKLEVLKGVIRQKIIPPAESIRRPVPTYKKSIPGGMGTT